MLQRLLQQLSAGNNKAMAWCCLHLCLPLPVSEVCQEQKSEKMKTASLSGLLLTCLKSLKDASHVKLAFAKPLFDLSTKQHLGWEHGSVSKTEKYTRSTVSGERGSCIGWYSHVLE